MCIAEQMAEVGNRLRGENGVRYAYYVTDQNGNTQKSNKRSIRYYGICSAIFWYGGKYKLCCGISRTKCFVTNQEDVEAFGSEKGCEISAKAYYKAICKYLNIEPISDNI